MTKRGDCIIGVSASKSVADLAGEVARCIRMDGAEVTFRIMVSGRTFRFTGRGDSRLTLGHPSESVIRKSGFVSSRTLAIFATAAAKDVPRAMVRSLREGSRGLIEVEVNEP